MIHFLLKTPIVLITLKKISVVSAHNANPIARKSEQKMNKTTKSCNTIHPFQRPRPTSHESEVVLHVYI
jgi:hypothetical protein